jgi:hypothetical protein
MAADDSPFDSPIPGCAYCDVKLGTLYVVDTEGRGVCISCAREHKVNGQRVSAEPKAA